MADVGVAVTPKEADMEVVASAANIKIAYKAGDLTLSSKLSNVLGVVIAGVIAVCVSTVLADGKSVIVLKDNMHLPIITNRSMEKYGFHYRADELLGASYGIGLHHDQSGYTWTEVKAGKTVSQLFADLGIPAVAAAVPHVVMTDALKHPVPLLECDALQAAGRSAMTLGFIADVAAVALVIFHSLALTGMLPHGIVKPVAGLVWFVLSAGFLVVLMIGVGAYTATWTCHNILIPEIKISDHFEFNYGFYFACVGYVSSVLVLAVTLCFTSTKPDDPPVAAAVTKTVAGVLTGATLGMGLCLIVAGSLGAFDPPAPISETINPCHSYYQSQKPKHLGVADKYFDNVACTKDSITQTLEQAAANVTRGYKGNMDAADRVPITVPYDQTDLCPVNVHWHLGAEHLSVGEFDEQGKGRMDGIWDHDTESGKEHEEEEDGGQERRSLAAKGGPPLTRGHQCHWYKKDVAMYNTDYAWQYCDATMKVGETYEVHWPHSAAGMCGTKWQYQTPFYDGVFCKDGIIEVAPLNTYKKIGVQAQTFVIVNSDEPAYQYDDLFKGMIVDRTHGVDMAMYTGSTTGTSRDAFTTCSRFTPITWQVDRKCHVISAKSFDKLCKDMKYNGGGSGDSMKDDLHAHGARETVHDDVTANNQQSRK